MCQTKSNAKQATSLILDKLSFSLKMHLSYVLAFLVQAAAFVAAADEPPKVKWTLHKSCCK